jgi:hypothetical protein
VPCGWAVRGAPWPCADPCPCAAPCGAACEATGAPACDTTGERACAPGQPSHTDRMEAARASANRRERRGDSDTAIPASEGILRCPQVLGRSPRLTSRPSLRRRASGQRHGRPDGTSCGDAAVPRQPLGEQGELDSVGREAVPGIPANAAPQTHPRLAHRPDSPSGRIGEIDRPASSTRMLSAGRAPPRRAWDGSARPARPAGPLPAMVGGTVLAFRDRYAGRGRGFCVVGPQKMHPTMHFFVTARSEMLDNSVAAPPGSGGAQGLTADRRSRRGRTAWPGWSRRAPASQEDC